VDDAHGVITATETTAGDVDEATRLLPLVVAHEQHTQQPPTTVVADSKYGTVENYRVGQLRGLRTHMADLHTKQHGPGRQTGIYREDQFRYDTQRDAYQCPAGQWLPQHHWHAGRKLWEYRAAPGVCAACPQRMACTRAKAGRSVRRHWQPEFVARGRAQAASAAARRDRHRRQYLLEGSFADAANNHGFKRARWRGLWRQMIQDNLIAGVQNIRILLRGRRAGVTSGAQALRVFPALAGRPGQSPSRRHIFHGNSPLASGWPIAMFGWN
jgi:hypothetical protein